VIAELRDIVNAPQFSWVQVSIRKSALGFRGLPMPVTITVAARYFFATSKARILNVLVPLWENTTTISLAETAYFVLTKSKLCTYKGSLQIVCSV
jgi:hypothetical protein